MKKFLRRLAKRHSKLGRKRKKKLKWHRPRGRDNKMREKRKGRPASVSIGYKSPSDRSMKKIIFVNSVKDANDLGKDQVIMLGRMGMRKKIEAAKKSQERGFLIKNLNVKKFLKGQKTPKEAKK